MHLQYALLKCRNSASEMHKILKTACGDNAIGKHRFFIDFVNSNIGKFWLKLVNIQDIPTQVTLSARA